MSEAEVNVEGFAVESRPAVPDGQKQGGQTRDFLIRYYYTGAAVLLLVLMFWGFSRFYLHGQAYPGREIPPPIKTLMITHGVAMTGWMVLFLVQPLLIVNRRYRVHRRLGAFGAGLAAVLVILGVMLGIASARIAPPDLVIFGFLPPQFMLVPLGTIFQFAVFVALGVWMRKQREAHRPLMLLSILATMSAPLARIDSLNALCMGGILESIFGPFVTSVGIALLLFGVHCALTRSVNRWFAGGTVFLALAGFAIPRIATTGVWEGFANFLIGA